MVIIVSKRKRQLNIDTLLKEGRGTGQGSNYKPWITIQDVPSLGRSTRLKGIKTQRQHEFLSDLERDYFYLLEFSDIVEDIREQYPLLPYEETILIADELGLQHPTNPKTGEIDVMTTDFLISINYKNKVYDVARTIKSKADLMDKRVIEKFEIERRYWEKQGINWGIVSDEEIDKTIAHNISFSHSCHSLKCIDAFLNINELELNDLVFEFLKRSIDTNKSIRSVCTEFDGDMYLEKGSSLNIFKFLIINKIIEIDITKKIDINKYIPIHLREESLRKVAII